MDTNERPKIKIPLTSGAIIMEGVAGLLLIGFWIYTVTHYAALPEQIPTHFSGDGTVDGYGSKETLLILPLLGTGMYIMLSIFAKYPHKFNYLTTITEANAPKQYAIAVQMLSVLKIALILVFFALAYKTVQETLGVTAGLGGWFMCMIMSFIFVPLFYFLIQLSKNS